MLQARKSCFYRISVIFSLYCFMIETQVLLTVSNFWAFLSRNHLLEGSFTFQWWEGLVFSWGALFLSVYVCVCMCVCVCVGGGGASPWGALALMRGLHGGHWLLLGGFQKKSHGMEGAPSMPPTLWNPLSMPNHAHLNSHHQFVALINMYLCMYGPVWLWLIFVRPLSESTVLK